MEGGDGGVGGGNVVDIVKDKGMLGKVGCEMGSGGCEMVDIKWVGGRW